MGTSLVMMEQRPPARCQECPWARCDFRPSLVRFYLVVYRQAQLAREPFDAVLLSRTRSSRSIDPWARSNVPDADVIERARAIGWALDQVARDHGATFMHSANADAVARILCPERYNEAER